MDLSCRNSEVNALQVWPLAWRYCCGIRLPAGVPARRQAVDNYREMPVPSPVEPGPPLDGAPAWQRSSMFVQLSRACQAMRISTGGGFAVRLIACVKTLSAPWNRRPPDCGQGTVGQRRAPAVGATWDCSSERSSRGAVARPVRWVPPRHPQLALRIAASPGSQPEIPRPSQRCGCGAAGEFSLLPGFPVVVIPYTASPRVRQSGIKLYLTDCR
jgi:hypothetical protein